MHVGIGGLAKCIRMHPLGEGGLDLPKCMHLVHLAFICIPIIVYVLPSMASLSSQLYILCTCIMGSGFCI